MTTKREPAIMFVKPGAVSDDDRSVLRDAGIIVVAIDDPASVRLVQAGHDLPASALLAAAGKAIQQSEAAQKAFGAALGKALELQFASKQ